MGPRHLAEKQNKKNFLDFEGGIGMMNEILEGVGVICKAFIASDASSQESFMSCSGR